MRKKLSKIGMGIIYLLLGSWVLAELYPIFYMYMSAFKSDGEIIRNPFGLPKSLDLSNLITVWNGGNVGTNFSVYFINSTIITVCTLILLCTISLFCGYALSRFKFPGCKLIYIFMVFLIAIPVHSLLIPIYSFGRALHMIDNRFYIILVYTAINMPFSIIIMKSYFESIPISVEEAARIDGCSDFQVFKKISVPMSFSAVATLIIVNVVGIWSELMFSSVLLTKTEVRTLPIGITMFASGMYSSSAGSLMASLVISTTPLLVVYFVFQKQIMQGMAAGSIK
jgi:raffinose/stachyose/melibiose transport system permease protein